MTWQIDYFLKCDLCLNLEYMDGKTKSDALKTARGKGWYVNAKTSVCNLCLEKHKLAKNFQKSVRRAQA